jgi:hypothetical protein
MVVAVLQDSVIARSHPEAKFVHLRSIKGRQILEYTHRQDSSEAQQQAQYLAVLRARSTWSAQSESGFRMDALALHFELYEAACRRQQPCPCLWVELNGVRVLRLLEYANVPLPSCPCPMYCSPELKEGFVSAGRLLLATGHSPAAGLSQFPTCLRLASLDLSLSPFEDLWIALDRARELADALGCFEALQAFLDPATRLAYSVYDAAETSFVHNWRIPLVPSEEYSLSRMRSTHFSHLIPLKDDQQMRTPADRQLQLAQPTPTDALLSNLCRWSLLALDEADSLVVDPQMHVSLLWHTWNSMLQILEGSTGLGERPPGLNLTRSSLEEPGVQKLWLADASSRIALHLLRQPQPAHQEAPPPVAIEPILEQRSRSDDLADLKRQVDLLSGAVTNLLARPKDATLSVPPSVTHGRFTSSDWLLILALLLISHLLVLPLHAQSRRE